MTKRYPKRYLLEIYPFTDILIDILKWFKTYLEISQILGKDILDISNRQKISWPWNKSRYLTYLEISRKGIQSQMPTPSPSCPSALYPIVYRELSEANGEGKRTFRNTSETTIPCALWGSGMIRMVPLWVQRHTPGGFCLEPPQRSKNHRACGLLWRMKL